MSQICIFDMSFKISNKICALCLTIYDSMIIAQATSENNNKVSSFNFFKTFRKEFHVENSDEFI